MRNTVNNSTEFQDKCSKKIYNLRVEKLVREASDNFIYYKDYETALEQLDEALSLEPDHLKALILMGDLMLFIDKDRESLEYFERAIKSNPYSAEAYGSKAGVLDILGKQKDALQSCEKAFEYITLKDRHILSSLYDQKIAILMRMKKYDEAREVLKKSIKSLTDEESSYLVASYQNLIESSSKDKRKKREMVMKMSLELVYS